MPTHYYDCLANLASAAILNQKGIIINWLCKKLSLGKVWIPSEFHITKQIVYNFMIPISSAPTFGLFRYHCVLSKSTPQSYGTLLLTLVQDSSSAVN